MSLDAVTTTPNAEEEEALTSGARLRREIAEKYEIAGPAAIQLVDMIAKTADELELLEAALEEYGPLIAGSRGQLVASPALAGLSRHRQTLARLLAQAFPAEHETVSEQAARAARTRWRARRGVT